MRLFNQWNRNRVFLYWKFCQHFAFPLLYKKLTIFPYCICNKSKFNKNLCKRAPKSVDLVKIREKCLKIRTKALNIWAKYLKTFAKSLKILKNSLKIRAKMAPSVLWFEKHGAQLFFIWKNGAQNHMKTFFFEVIWNAVFVRKYSHKDWIKIFSGKFGTFGQKSFAPPKICLLIHLWCEPQRKLWNMKTLRFDEWSVT